jgi:hypothetical protein
MTINELLKSDAFTGTVLGATEGGWIPMGFFLCGDKLAGVTAFEGGMTPQEITKCMEQMMLENGWTDVALIQEVWGSADCMKLGVRPSHAPDRKSAIIVSVYKLRNGKFTNVTKLNAIYEMSPAFQAKEAKAVA